MGFPPFIVRIGMLTVFFLYWAGGLLILTLVLQKLVLIPKHFELTIVSAIGAFSLVAAIFTENRHARRFASKEQLKELTEGTCVVFPVRTDQVILIAESQNGHGALVRLDKAKTLFLAGPYLSELISDGRFPCHTFSVVLTPATRTVLDVICNEDRFPPIAIIPKLPETFTVNRTVPEDGEIVDVDIGSFFASQGS